MYGLNLTINWLINNTINLFFAWFPNNIDPSQLTPENLDRLRDIVRLVRHIIGYLEPMITNIDATTLNIILNGLITLSRCMMAFWLQCEYSIEGGNITEGDTEALEVYHGILLQAAGSLRGLILSIQEILNR